MRHLASGYAYDEGDDRCPGTRRSRCAAAWTKWAPRCRASCSERFEQAGVVVEDAKLTHLAYAPEIAGVMLRRQQAEAIIAARQKIVTARSRWWRWR